MAPVLVQQLYTQYTTFLPSVNISSNNSYSFLETDNSFSTQCRVSFEASHCDIRILQHLIIAGDRLPKARSIARCDRFESQQLLDLSSRLSPVFHNFIIRE